MSAHCLEEGCQEDVLAMEESDLEEGCETVQPEISDEKPFRVEFQNEPTEKRTDILEQNGDEQGDFEMSLRKSRTEISGEFENDFASDAWDANGEFDICQWLKAETVCSDAAPEHGTAKTYMGMTFAGELEAEATKRRATRTQTSERAAQARRIDVQCAAADGLARGSKDEGEDDGKRIEENTSSTASVADRVRFFNLATEEQAARKHQSGRSDGARRMLIQTVTHSIEAAVINEAKLAWTHKSISKLSEMPQAPADERAESDVDEGK